MSFFNFAQGAIQLFALPGTEDYVQKVSKWITTHLLDDINKHKASIADYFYMDDDDEDRLIHAEIPIEDFLNKYLIGQFSYYIHRNGAVEISLKKSSRRRDVYIFHTFSEVEITDENGIKKRLTLADQELLLYNTLDALLGAKVRKITLFELNLGQARSDKPKGRGSCNLRTFFRNITANGLKHLMLYQIHSEKSLIGIDTTRTAYDNLKGEKILKKYILRNYVKTLDFFNNVVKKDWIFSSVDAGGKSFATTFSRSFKVPLLVVDKRRDPITNKIEEITILKPESLSVKDKVVFIVDDMIDSGGSIADVCRKYKELGAREINIAVCYGLFSDPAEKLLNDLVKEGALNKVIIMDLVLHDKAFYDRNPYIDVADTSYTTARIVEKNYQGKSLEKYFEPFDAEVYLSKIFTP